MLKRRLFAFLFLLMFSPSLSRGAVEIQTNFIPSIGIVGRADLVLSTHNTLLFGTSGFLFGVFASYETISVNVTDLSYGAALRFMESPYVELQAGLFQRDFSQHTLNLQGRGFIANIILGTHLNNVFGLAVFLSGKRIDSGTLDKRTIIDLLPFLTLRAEL